jgi:hypothetical protein
MGDANLTPPPPWGSPTLWSLTLMFHVEHLASFNVKQRDSSLSTMHNHGYIQSLLLLAHRAK